MKNFSLLPAFVPAFLLCGCVRENVFPSGSFRTERYPVERDAADSAIGPDILLSGVEYDAAYDWQHDSAWADEPYSVVLLKGGKVVQRSSGVRVHILDSHGLWCDEGSFVSLGSKCIFTKDVSETMTDVLYPWLATSSQGGWKLRKLGNVVLEGGGGLRPFYTDGNTVLCSSVEPFGGQKEYYVIEDGEKHAVAGLGDVLDARLVGGVCYVLRRHGALGYSLSWQYGSIEGQIGGAEAMIDGRIRGDLLAEFTFTLPWTSTMYGTMLLGSDGGRTTVRTDGFAVMTDRADTYVCCSRDGVVSGMAGGEAFELERPVRYFSERCVCLSPEGRLMMALTPREGRPGLWIDGRVLPVDLHGYLTGVCQAR